MKKRLSHFPYNERSRPGWTPSTSLRKPLSPIRSTMKTVTYVPGTFVTLVPGPYISPATGERREGAASMGGRVFASLTLTPNTRSETLMHSLLMSDGLRRNAWKFPLKMAAKDRFRQITYSELNSRVNQLAHGFLSLVW